MSLTLDNITEARAKLMAAMPDMADAINAAAMPSAEQLASFNAVLSKDSVTKRPKTEAQAYRRSQLNRLKQQNDRSVYKQAVHQMLLAHYREQMASGGLTQIDGGKLAKRANYQSSGVDEIEALISSACNECPTE
jgi:DNA polymerase III alpha subunit